jgi:two-component system phosphate regulon response regulator PhoB
VAATDAESVLVIDDEPDLCRLLVVNLTQAGFTAESAGTGEGGLAAAARLNPAVIVLDLMLPDLPGTEVCRRLRADDRLGDVGILMLTARGDEFDRVVGFELGTDDYVVKPFSPRELVLRVRALARRCSERRAARSAKGSSGGGRLVWRDLELDPVAHRVYAKGAELSLRPMEFKLVQLFLEHPREVYSRERLLEEVWGSSDEVNPRTVDTHVRRLRERLGVHGEAIETVHGFGYRLREP